MKMTIDQNFREATERIDDFIELLYIKAIGRIHNFNQPKKDTHITQEMIESFLQKRGYIRNTLSNSDVFTKGFVIISTKEFSNSGSLEIWHDKTGNPNHSFIHESVLTGLPIALNYFERI